MSINLPAGETQITPYSGERATATHQPSERHAQSNMFLATPDQSDNHVKPSTLRRRADSEVGHANNKPSGINGNPETRINDTREENLRRQVERLMVENEALREHAIPPPYTDNI